MKKWLFQTSTIGGLTSLLATGIQLYQSGGNAMTVFLGVLTAALLLVRDGKFLAGLAALLFVGGSSVSCSYLPIPQDVQVKAAVTVGCNLMDQANCFADISIQAAFPGISRETCPDTISYLGEAAQIVTAGGTPAQTTLAVLDKVDLDKFDPSKIAGLEKASCSRAARALGVK